MSTHTGWQHAGSKHLGTGSVRNDFGFIAYLLTLCFLIAYPAALLSAAKDGAKQADQPTLLVLGDSLSAGYGLASKDGWVALLQARLATRGWRVVNASISGETTAGGRSRIDAELARHQPKLVLLALGANDGLRGLPVSEANGNLRAMVRAAKQAKARVLLVGMEMPPNYGPAYTAAFRQMYTTLASEEKIALLPFLLEPIARERDAFQADNLHPVAAVQPRLLEHVWKALEPLLKAG